MCCWWTVKRWCILDVLARLPDSLPVNICLPCLSSRDALFGAWPMARLQCWWLPRLWYMAPKPAVPNQGYWATCLISNSYIHYLNSGMFNKMPLSRFVFIVVDYCWVKKNLSGFMYILGCELLEDCSWFQELSIQSWLVDVLHWDEDTQDSWSSRSLQHLYAWISWWYRLC